MDRCGFGAFCHGAINFNSANGVVERGLHALAFGLLLTAKRGQLLDQELW